jgi:hypothetical protein
MSTKVSAVVLVLASRGLIVFDGADSRSTVASQVSEMAAVRDKVYQMEQAQISLKQK